MHVKLKLEDLKVRSFVTNPLDVKGGWAPPVTIEQRPTGTYCTDGFCTSPEGCSQFYCESVDVCTDVNYCYTGIEFCASDLPCTI